MNKKIEVPQNQVILEIRNRFSSLQDELVGDKLFDMEQDMVSTSKKLEDEPKEEKEP